MSHFSRCVRAQHEIAVTGLGSMRSSDAILHLGNASFAQRPGRPKPVTQPCIGLLQSQPAFRTFAASRQ